MTKFARILLLTTLIASSGTDGVQQQVHGMQKKQATTSEADKLAMVRCGIVGDNVEAQEMVNEGVDPFVRDVDSLNCLEHAVISGHGGLARSLLRHERVAKSIKSGRHDTDLVALALLCGEYGDDATFGEIMSQRPRIEASRNDILAVGYWKSGDICLKLTEREGLAIDKVGLHSVWYVADKRKVTRLTLLNANILDGNYSACEQILKKLEAGKVNTKDTQGRTPLMLAASVGDEKLVGLLIRNGAKVNLQDAKKRTALDYAARMGSMDVVKLLLENGAYYYYVPGRQIENSEIEKVLLDQYFVKDS
jgi:hypothetical protein